MSTAPRPPCRDPNDRAFDDGYCIDVPATVVVEVFREHHALLARYPLADGRHPTPAEVEDAAPAVAVILFALVRAAHRRLVSHNVAVWDDHVHVRLGTGWEQHRRDYEGLFIAVTLFRDVVCQLSNLSTSNLQPGPGVVGLDTVSAPPLHSLPRDILDAALMIVEHVMASPVKHARMVADEMERHIRSLSDSVSAPAKASALACPHCGQAIAVTLS
jgi:hypothetical protein